MDSLKILRIELDIVFYTSVFIIYSFLLFVNEILEKYIVFFDLFKSLVYNQL